MERWGRATGLSLPSMWVSSFPHALGKPVTKSSECSWHSQPETCVHTFFYSVILCTGPWFEASCGVYVSSTSLNIFPDSNRKVAESSRKYHGFIGSVVIYALGQGFWLLMG